MNYSLTCHSDEAHGFKCSIIGFDNVSLLLDPAWNGQKTSVEEFVTFWSKLISQVDIVIITRPLKESLGAFGLLYQIFLAHFKSRIAVYATLPVANLGRVTTIDLYASQGLLGPVETNAMDLEDVEQAFDHITAIKYAQTVDLKSKFEGLSLVAYNAGSTIGGSFYCITTYSEKILYMPQWNHTRDTILNSAALLDDQGKPLSALLRPSAVVTAAELTGSSITYRKRAQKFKELLRNVTSRGGTALIPSSMGGRFLDMFVLTHDLLYDRKRQRSAGDIPVLVVSYSRGRSLTYARSMLEWLSSAVIKTWEARNGKSPFDIGSKLKFVTPKDLPRYPGPKICFVSDVETLVNQVAMKLCTQDKTTVILTNPDIASSSAVLKQLYEKWCGAKKISDKDAFERKPVSFSKTISINAFEDKTLQGESLQHFTAMIGERRSKRSELLEKLDKESARIKGVEPSDAMAGDEDDEDDEEDGMRDIISAANRSRSSNLSSNRPITIPVDTQIQPNVAPRLKMFPFQPGKIKSDDYGTVVDFSAFISEEDKNSNKRSATDVFSEEDDPYDIENSFKAPKKNRSEGPVPLSSSSSTAFSGDKDENHDDVTYLDSLKSPVTRVPKEEQVNLNCSVAFIDLGGLVDQRSMSVILPSLKPRSVLLLASPQRSESSSMALRNKNVEVILLEANVEKQFDASVKMIEVALDPELDQNLKWQTVSTGYTVAHVMGRLIRDISHTDRSSHKINKFVLKPLSNTTRVQPKVSLAIGDVKLAELKRRLTQQNHVAEFKGEGALVIDGKVAVRKISEGETIVDGTPSKLFYEVKAAVSNMLAKV
ncbi:LAMI_0H16578g1_1 [Lachancea mirantina]|uniref:Cleavage and polyadenylation specificity factor subunit 2 n=1 Tax=Lachancea mirantina TaxID=1230905 RepID=A0A1G4KJ66_9SACH|nr:LAMI_0H16578g1_1 [Lachancea mirantina]